VPLVSVTVITLLASCGRDGSGSGSQQGGEADIRIAAASDLQFALEELIAAYGEDNPEESVVASYGSSGTFFSQLQSEAPFDLYLSADMTYPQQLEEDGLTLPDSLFEYAVGRIVVWVRGDSDIDVEQLGMDALLDPSVRKIAIADPDHAPYGRAAVAAMESYGIYDEVQDGLVLGENISQTAQFVQSGGADIGIIALSLALAPGADGRYWDIPLERYPAILQGGATMRWARDPEATHGFVAFMLGERGREILETYGFTMPTG
jgi:molybdate transport system substrate-binding protein